MPRFKVNVPIKYEMEIKVEAKDMDEAWSKAVDMAVFQHNVSERNIDDWLVERALGIEEFVEEVRE